MRFLREALQQLCQGNLEEGVKTAINRINDHRRKSASMFAKRSWPSPGLNGQV